MIRRVEHLLFLLCLCWYSIHLNWRSSACLWHRCLWQLRIFFCQYFKREVFLLKTIKRTVVLERIRWITKTSFKRRWWRVYAARSWHLLLAIVPLVLDQAATRASLYFDGYLGRRRGHISVRMPDPVGYIGYRQSQTCSSGLPAICKQPL